jgi:hypothetical protein
MKHYYQNIEGFFTWPDLYVDAVRNVPDNAVMVEVGVLKGKSFSHLMTEIHNSGKNIRAYAVDDFKTLMGWKWDENVREAFTLNLAPHGGKYQTIIDSSTNAAAMFSYNIVDFLFLDASHDYESVKKDIEAWLPKMKPGSVMAGHDYTDDWEGLKKAVHEVFGDRVQVLNDCWRVQL